MTNLRRVGRDDDLPPCLISAAKSWPTPRTGPPRETFGGYQDVAGYTRNEVVSEHMRAIWDALQERGFTYVNAPQAYTSTNAQNIKFPSATYEDATDNCIERVVMFASLMEAIGFTANLIYIPGHAWIGIDQWSNDPTVLPFETTALGHADFDSAADIGHERWLEHESRSGFIVYDLDELRRLAIASNPWFAAE